MAHPPLSVSDGDLEALHDWVHGSTSAPGKARRARIVVLSATGLGTTAIAAELGCSPQTVVEWRERYRRFGLAGLVDAPRSGRPVSVDGEAVLRQMMRPVAGGAQRWSSRSVGAALGVSNVTVANTWRAAGVAPADGGRVRLATRPPLDLASAALLGMHVDASVRLLALQLSWFPPDDRDGGGAWHELCDLLRGLVDDAPAPVGDTDVNGFVAALTQAGSVSVIVDGVLGTPPAGVGVHTATSESSWCTLAGIACMATATGPGSGSASDLLDALRRRRSGHPISWVARST